MTASTIIKSLRTKHGFTQEDMAQRLEISRQTYTNLENNPTKADLEKVYKIFNLLNEPIDDFLYAVKQDYLSQKEGE